MSSIEIRAFERRDREQLTELVNARVDAEGLAIRRVVGHNGTAVPADWLRLGGALGFRELTRTERG